MKMPARSGDYALIVRLHERGPSAWIPTSGGWPSSMTGKRLKPSPCNPFHSARLRLLSPEWGDDSGLCFPH